MHHHERQIDALLSAKQAGSVIDRLMAMPHPAGPGPTEWDRAVAGRLEAHLARHMRGLIDGVDERRGDAVRFGSAASSGRRPVLHSQTRHMAEGAVVADERSAGLQGMRGDQHVERPERLADSFEVGAKTGIQIGGLFRPRQDIDFQEEGRHCLSHDNLGRSTVQTEPDFPIGHGGYKKLVRSELGHASLGGRQTPCNQMAYRIRVEQEFAAHSVGSSPNGSLRSCWC